MTERRSLGTGLGRWIDRAVNRVLRPTSRLEVSGLTATFLNVDAAIHRRIVRAGGERRQLEDFLGELRAGDVVWDVGSFIGMFSVFSSLKVGSTGRVIAFEPEPEARRIVSRNRTINALDHLRILPCALGSEEAEAEIHPSIVSGVATHSLLAGEGVADAGTAVAVRRGDRLVADGEIPAPDVVKIDVEGGEADAVRGMRDVLGASRCRFVMIEVHPEALGRFGSSPEEVVALMRSCGFVVETSLPRGTEIHQYFRKEGAA